MSSEIATRCSGDSRFVLSRASPSAMAFAHSGRCRLVMQEFGQRSGRHWARAGAVRSVLPLRQSAVPGSKKQSFNTPTNIVLATWLSMARTRAGSATWPGRGSSFSTACCNSPAMRLAAGPSGQTRSASLTCHRSECRVGPRNFASSLSQIRT